MTFLIALMAIKTRLLIETNISFLTSVSYTVIF